MWGPCVKVEGTRGPRKSSSRRLLQQDAANVVWAAEAAEVGRTGGKSRAQRPECRRLAKPKCRGEKKS
ncbi:hypothetical protein QL093DRAFT_2512934, partial [Fusarium oxysporum]